MMRESVRIRFNTFFICFLMISASSARAQSANVSPIVEDGWKLAPLITVNEMVIDGQQSKILELGDVFVLNEKSLLAWARITGSNKIINLREFKKDGLSECLPDEFGYSRNPLLSMTNAGWKPAVRTFCGIIKKVWQTVDEFFPFNSNPLLVAFFQITILDESWMKTDLCYFAGEKTTLVSRPSVLFEFETAETKQVGGRYPVLIVRGAHERLDLGGIFSSNDRCRNCQSWFFDARFPERGLQPVPVFKTDLSREVRLDHVRKWPGNDAAVVCLKDGIYFMKK